MTDIIRKKYYTIAYDFLARVLRTPPYIILFLSDTCPNNCSHCWYNSEWKKKNLSGRMLSFEELDKISKSIKNIHFITMTGGEAFLRNDIAEIVTVFNKNTKLGRCDIPTSGFDNDMICEKAIRILESNKDMPFRIDVSIDGLDEKHDNIRQNQGLFKEACKTINSLQKIKIKYPNLDVAIITTISEYNNSEIEQLSKFIENILPEGEWMVNICRPPTKEKPIANANLEAYKFADNYIKSRIKNNRFKGDSGHKIGKILTVKNSLRRKIISDILQNKRKGGGCSGGSLIGAIMSDGEVSPCEMYDMPIGNIRDYDYNLERLWNSDNAKKMRTKIQDDLCLCTNECFWSTNILIQPSCWVGMFKELVKSR